MGVSSPKAMCGPTLLMAFEQPQFLNNETGNCLTWCLDSGASNHMSGNKHVFADLDESITVMVSFGDNSQIPVKGKGHIAILLKDGYQEWISDVYFVPQMKSNILSLGHLMEKGIVILMRDNSFVMTAKTGKRIAAVEMSKNRMFLLSINHNMQCMTVSLNDPTDLWHQRFGHLNLDALNMLSKRELVTGLPAITVKKEKSCEACRCGKQTRAAFKVVPHVAAQRLLEVVHNDVCGPFQVPSFGGSYYFLLFVDDKSRKTWIFFMKAKSEASALFKKFKKLVENQTYETIGTLITDRGGGEFCSQAFKQYCEDNGVRKITTQPYTPQQNDLVEGRNRTIMNMVRSMLKNKKLPLQLWAEAAATAVYLMNRSPTKGLGDVTPQEVWSGHKPSVKHFRVFGSLVYVHILSQLRRKLDDRSKKYIFVGYDTSSRGYELMDPTTKHVINSRDCQFEDLLVIV
ncbi:hypothetical protein Dimus_038245 [Dionaea muscipula]